MRTGAPDFAHLARLTDDAGLFEHARYAIARREHGYCTDDVARGLVVTGREPDPSATVVRLALGYLDFVTRAQDRTGAFHNRLGPDRRWRDTPSVGDWWGRALWGLGTAAASPIAELREPAMAGFDRGAVLRSPHLRAMAFAGLGAAEVLRAQPGHTIAAALLADAAAAVGMPATDPDWRWPTPALTYANAALPHVLIAAGHLGRDETTLCAGVRMLTWLYQNQLVDDHLSVVAVAGWRRDQPRDRYDQQPIEVAAIADACAAAAMATGDPSWESGIRHAIGWFEGHNDGGTAMWDPTTGGAYDGLTPHGPNLNQGAESTLALISTRQHVRDLSRRDVSRSLACLSRS
jgi:hypothetical protein